MAQNLPPNAEYPPHHRRRDGTQLHANYTGSHSPFNRPQTPGNNGEKAVMNRKLPTLLTVDRKV